MEYKQWGASVIYNLVAFIQLITFSVMGFVTFVFISSISLSLIVAVFVVSLLYKIKHNMLKPQKKHQAKRLTLDEEKA